MKKLMCRPSLTQLKEVLPYIFYGADWPTKNMPANENML